jgi:hypothetical protein
MATAEILSDVITNAEAVPRTFNGAVNDCGKLRIQTGTFETTTGLDAADIVALCKVPAAASVKSIKLYLDALTSGAVDIGLYTGPNSSNLTVADVDAYASAQALGGGADKAGLECAFEARDIANINKRVYEDCADSLGEFSEYWICMTVTTDLGAAGTVSYRVEYVGE